MIRGGRKRPAALLSIKSKTPLVRSTRQSINIRNSDTDTLAQAEAGRKPSPAAAETPSGMDKTLKSGN